MSAAPWGRGSEQEELLVRTISTTLDAKWRYDKKTGGISISAINPHQSVKLRNALDEEHVPYKASIKNDKIIYRVPHASQWWRHDYARWKHLGDNNDLLAPKGR